MNNPLPVITVWHKNREYIRPWFWFFHRCTEIPTIIYGIDNGSDDESFQEALAHKRTDDKFYQMPRNLGLGLALNSSTRMICEDFPDTEFFCFIESDVYLSEFGMIEKAIETLEKNPTAYQVRFPLRSMRSGGIHYGIGAAVVRMKVWREFGGFAYGYNHWCEDFELQAKAEKNGWKKIDMNFGMAVHITGGTVNDKIPDARKKHNDFDEHMYRARQKHKHPWA